MTLLYLLGGAAVALGATSLLYEWWMRRISLAWPVAEAKLDSSNVEQARTRYVLRLRYSYFVSGSLYGGTWFKYFRTQKEAEHLWKSLNGLLVLVRYDPHRPERSYFDPYRDVRIGEIGKA
jgi:hypothetical protein